MGEREVENSLWVVASVATLMMHGGRFESCSIASTLVIFICLYSFSIFL